MISYEEALSIILRAGQQGFTLETETVTLEKAVGRICGEEIRAPMANQPFDNSAMDGFALRAEELHKASAAAPVSLEVTGHLAAGGVIAQRPPQPGQCYEIMTGAPLPPGCDAVVPVEKTRRNENGRVLFHAPAERGENIRLAGEDFSVGDKVLERGVCVISEHLLALATLGVGEMRVLRRPKAALMSTGQEVVDDLAMKLAAGQIYNSTKPYLVAKMMEMGMELPFARSVGDDENMFRSQLLLAAEKGCDIVLSTGAVSAGAHDFVPDVLKELGAEIFFHKVAIRPGKPLVFAKFPRGGPFFFGLPGNPASTAVGLRFFVYPLLRAMQGLGAEKPLCIPLAENYGKKKAGLRFFLRGVLETDERGLNGFRILQEQQSFMVNPFTKSNAWAVLPEEASALKAGDIVQVFQ